MPKGKLALISQWAGQSGKEYKKKSLAPEAAKGAGSRDDTNVEFLNGAGKKILNNNQVCNRVLKSSPRVDSPQVFFNKKEQVLLWV